MAKKKDPKLWDRIVKEFKQSSKGGDKGQWTARKAQLAVQKYKDQGGRYAGKKDESDSLARWSRQGWQYSSKEMKERGGRYLPGKVWEQLSPNQKRATNLNKLRGSGKVPYEAYVKEAFKKAGIKMDQ
jgi:hypothetical protein